MNYENLDSSYMTLQEETYTQNDIDKAYAFGTIFGLVVGYLYGHYVIKT